MSTASRTTPARHVAVLVGSLVLLSSCSSSAKHSATTEAISASTVAPAVTGPITTQPATTRPETAEPETTQPDTAANTPATNSDGLPVGVPGGLADGVYTVQVTDADLAAVNLHEDEFAENHGTFTWTMAGGTWTWAQTADNVIHNPTDSGTYVVDGDDIVFYVTNDLGPQELKWSVNPDGSLQFTALASTSSYFTAYLASHPLVPKL